MLPKDKERIISELDRLPPPYQKEILDFIEFVKIKARESDTEYLQNMTGMVESMRRAMDENPGESLTLEDIGWGKDV
jgi:hypothetical protein